MLQNIEILPLQSCHLLDKFNCGIPPLDDYLKKYAAQNAKKNISQVYVAVSKIETNRVMGYYTLSAAEISFQHLPPPHQKRIPKYPIPAARIGRLAVDSSCKGHGLGKELLMHALNQAKQSSMTIGIFTIIVDAKDDNAKAFYLKYGFIPFIGEASKLFLPLTSIP